MSDEGIVKERVIRPIGRFVKRVFPPADIWRIHYLAKRRGNIIKKYTSSSFDNYCKKCDGQITIVETATERVVYRPAYYPEYKGQEYRFKSGPIYIAELSDVTVHGGSGIVLSGEYALFDVSANDIEKRVNPVAGSIRRAVDKVLYLEETKDADELQSAVNLCGLAAGNYYHLTIEILSRYEYLRQYIGGRDIPVLLDEDARKFPQLEELVKTVLGNISVIYVPMYKKVYCKKLIYPSMNTWMPMNVRRKSNFRLSDNLIARSAVENIRKATEGLRKEKTGLKIFISRKNAALSRIENENEVAALFESNGYKVVCTEDLTYREQVELFSSAECIVGASGAALTNLVYCNKGTVFGCIIPEKYEFCIYSSIAHMVGCKVMFLNAKAAKNTGAISTDRYKVSADMCEQYISCLWRIGNEED